MERSSRTVERKRGRGRKRAKKRGRGKEGEGEGVRKGRRQVGDELE